MTNEEKLINLEEELVKTEARLEHMAMEYSETRGGSAYGVEYYDIQVKVYQEMVANIKMAIDNLKEDMRNKDGKISM
jgi:hypothetical protein